MAIPPVAPAGCAEALRSLARRLGQEGRLELAQSGLTAEELAGCLEAAARALPPEPPAPPQPDAGPAASSGPLVLHADGGSRGNPGPAGAGAVLLDAAGRQLASWHRFLGVATNNVAEYQALILGLEGALARGVTRLEVRLDSELLVKQMKGLYQVKSPHLKPLHAQARALARRFERLAFRHIPREQNALADRLANLAMDQG